MQSLSSICYVLVEIPACRVAYRKVRTLQARLRRHEAVVFYFLLEVVGIIRLLLRIDFASVCISDASLPVNNTDSSRRRATHDEQATDGRTREGRFANKALPLSGWLEGRRAQRCGLKSSSSMASSLTVRNRDPRAQEAMLSLRLILCSRENEYFGMGQVLQCDVSPPARS